MVGFRHLGRECDQLWILRGFAHRFVTIADNTEIQYKVTSLYGAPHDCGIRFDEPRLGFQ